MIHDPLPGIAGDWMLAHPAQIAEPSTAAGFALHTDEGQATR